MTHETLTDKGYEPLTSAYIMPQEEELLERALAPLKRNKTAYELLWLSDKEVEIWTIPKFPTPKG